MQHYIGTKAIQARPMNRRDYNDYRGWELPGDENGDDEGYLVEYLDGGKSNHPKHEGYISWSPKAQFEGAYQQNGKLSFGHALVMLKAGHRVARAGWNGKGMFVYMVPAANYEVQTGAAEKYFGKDALVPYGAYFALKGVNDIVNTWVPSVSDCLVEDWMVLA